MKNNIKEKNSIKNLFYRQLLTKKLNALCYNNTMGAIRMILDLLIKLNKVKLNKMIEQNENYEIILRQSQKLDTYITEKTIRLINKRNKLSKKDVPA